MAAILQQVHFPMTWRPLLSPKSYHRVSFSVSPTPLVSDASVSASSATSVLDLLPPSPIFSDIYLHTTLSHISSKPSASSSLLLLLLHHILSPQFVLPHIGSHTSDFLSASKCSQLLVTPPPLPPAAQFSVALRCLCFYHLQFHLLADPSVLLYHSSSDLLIVGILRNWRAVLGLAH
ncbi:hypothetical protein LINPERHAP2_LOCUS15529 [Linum perenne]